MPINVGVGTYAVYINCRTLYIFKQGTSIPSNGGTPPEIPVPNQKSITQRQIPILQTVNKIVNKIVSKRLTPKFFVSLSKVYVNQGGANWPFTINEVNLFVF